MTGASWPLRYLAGSSPVFLTSATSDERSHRDPVDVQDALGELQHDAFVLRILTVGTLCRQ